MDAIHHLLREHERVDKLFRRFVEAGEEAYKEKQQIAEDLIHEIWINARNEEDVLFPAFGEKGGEQAQEMILEGIEEHHVLEYIMDALKKTSPEDETFNARMKVLLENTRHHFLEEEREVFPEAKKVLGTSELERLGEEMEAHEKKLNKK